MSVITLQEYKMFKGINNPNQDTKLQPLVDSVNSIIEKYCQIALSPTQATGVRLTNHYSVLILPKAPVIEVTSVGIKRSSTETEILDPTQYLVDEEEGTLEIIDPMVNLPRNPYSFIVDFTYGMSSVPFALKQAAIELLTYYDKREFNKSKDIGNGQSIDFMDSNIMPPHIKTLLDLYRVL